MLFKNILKSKVPRTEPNLWDTSYSFFTSTECAVTTYILRFIFQVIKHIWGSTLRKSLDVYLAISSKVMIHCVNSFWEIHKSSIHAFTFVKCVFLIFLAYTLSYIGCCSFYGSHKKPLTYYVPVNSEVCKFLYKVSLFFFLKIERISASFSSFGNWFLVQSKSWKYYLRLVNMYQWHLLTGTSLSLEDFYR